MAQNQIKTNELSQSKDVEMKDEVSTAIDLTTLKSLIID